MAAGRTHNRFNLVVLFLILALPFEFFTGWDKFFFSVGFILSTFLISPDMDIHTSSVFRRWKLLRIFWLPYALIFKHRGLSHYPLLGTLTRVGYILVVLMVLLYILFGSFDALSQFIYENSRAFSYTILGMVVGDISHIVLDYTITYFKRWRR